MTTQVNFIAPPGFRSNRLTVAALAGVAAELAERIEARAAAADDQKTETWDGERRRLASALVLLDSVAVGFGCETDDINAPALGYA